MWILGILIILGFFGTLAILFLYKVPAENQHLLDISLGTLLSSFSMIVGYFYGSSKGSADKNDMINNLLNKQIDNKNA